MNGQERLDDDVYDDPLAPDNPLAVPLVDALRELVSVKRDYSALVDVCGGYRLLAQIAVGEFAERTKERDAARRTIERLREEIAGMRLGKAA